MPKIEVVRKGPTSYARPVPTDTTLAVLPMTLERVGKELADEEEEPKRIDGVAEAFQQFGPSVDFKAQVGEEATEFVVQLEPRSLEDFKPENVQKRSKGKRNDLADLRNSIDLLYALKDSWTLPAVKRAWNDDSQRKQLLAILSRFRAELEKVARQKGDE